jgi:hypothetical protein
MSKLGNSRLYISVHHESEEYTRRLEPVLALIESWCAEFDISVTMSASSTNWTRRYHGFGSEMRPYADNNPEQSWSKCPARSCIQLFDGKLWKCPALTYLRMQNDKYGLSDAWRTYLAYKPLNHDCSDIDLLSFANKKAEIFCGMCPAKPERFSLPTPFPSKQRAKMALW